MTDTTLGGAGETSTLLLPQSTFLRWRSFGGVAFDFLARAVLERHPEIRRVELVGVLVDGARSGEDSALRSRRALRRAAMLCGPDWPDGPELIGDLMTGEQALKTSELDRAGLDDLAALARRASDPDLAPVVPPGILGGLLDLAVEILAHVWLRIGDLRLLDEALAVKRRVVEATHPEAPIAPFRTTDLASWSVAKFKATGERALLDDALAVQRRGVESCPGNAFAQAYVLDGLAKSLGVLYKVTRRPDVLEEAVACQRRAVSLLEATDDETPGPVDDMFAPLLRRDHLQILSRLSELLFVQYATRRDPDLLEEAVGIKRRVVEGTPESTESLPDHLSHQVLLLLAQHEVSGERRWLEEAVTTQRRALAALPAGHTARPLFAHRVVDLVSKLAEATGDPELLDDAWAVTEHVHSPMEFEEADLGWMRAGLARRRWRPDRFAVAAREAAAAAEAVASLCRAGPAPGHRLDLARRFDGLLGDLVASTVRGGDVERGVELLEAGRVWLPAPAPSATEAARTLPPVPVAWVASSQWETVVVTTVDHRTYTSHVIERTRADIQLTVAVTMHVAEGGTPPDPEEGGPRWPSSRRQAVDGLCALATEIAAAFPREDRLLVVPLGFAALLPYAAARRGDGFLTDETSLTLAPSLAWARAAHRPRPDGPSVGAFHPGVPGGGLLDLDHERQTFRALVDAAILDRPSAEEVLAHLGGADIAHVCCREGLGAADPLACKLSLESDLTIRAILEHPAAPWLVNLSAGGSVRCHLRMPEQQISFPTAFILAGAAHVLTTIWPASPRSRGAVHEAFYRHLAEGLHPADARRRAVRHLRDSRRRDGVEPHPVRWATFTHVGSPW